MSVDEGAKTWVRVDCKVSEEFEVKVGMPQGSVLTSFVCVVVDVVTQLAREGVLSVLLLLYADDIVSISVVVVVELPQAPEDDPQKR